MNFDQAKEFLNECERGESRDHYFGDREIFWRKEINGEMVDVADGYFGGGIRQVWIMDPTVDMDRDEFSGQHAAELAKCGKRAIISRNDETGPDEYRGW